MATTARPREPMVVQTAVDEAFKEQVGRLFEVLAEGYTGDPRGSFDRFSKGLTAAMDAREQCIRVFVHGNPPQA